jgi:hypothetical protein
MEGEFNRDLHFWSAFHVTGLNPVFSDYALSGLCIPGVFLCNRASPCFFILRPFRALMFQWSSQGNIPAECCFYFLSLASSNEFGLPA